MPGGPGLKDEVRTQAGRELQSLVAAPALDLDMMAGKQHWRHGLAIPVFRPGVVRAIQQAVERWVEAVELMAVLVAQYARLGPWRDYLYGERVYMLLSLVAKSLLAWQVFSGTLRP